MLLTLIEYLSFLSNRKTSLSMTLSWRHNVIDCPVESAFRYFLQ